MQTHTKRRTVLGLLALVALAAGGFVVLTTWSAAVPQERSGSSRSCPIASLAAANKSGAFAAGISPQAEPTYPPGTIDGAKHPELIPDEVAYKMLFLSVMEPANLTDAQRARQEAKLRMIGFSEEDKAGFLAKLGEFRDRMRDCGARTAEILKATPNPPRDSAERQELSDIEEQATAGVTDTVEALRTGLTQEGFGKFQARMLGFKRTIKAFPMREGESGQ
ncbi:MAG: hypothetical protein ABSF71_12995 [Terriglobia bacterium]|jgi:hypothetical protein